MLLPPQIIRAKDIRHRGDRFKVAAKRAEAARHVARVGAVKPIGEVFVDLIEKVSPRDTNRFVRGWQMAANDAGLTRRPVLPVKDSNRRDEFIAALEGQVAYWAGQADRWAGYQRRYEAEDAKNPLRKDGTPRAKRTGQPAYRRYVRMESKALREMAKAEEILGEALGAEGFLLFDKGGFAAGRRARFGKRKRFRSTIRTRIYGGRGRITDAGGVAVITLHNLEPHASIVANSARHGRPVAFALRGVAALGGRKVTKGYADAIGAVTGWTQTRRGLARGDAPFTRAG